MKSKIGKNLSSHLYLPIPNITKRTLLLNRSCPTRCNQQSAKHPPPLPFSCESKYTNQPMCACHSCRDTLIFSLICPKVTFNMQRFLRAVILSSLTVRSPWRIRGPSHHRLPAKPQKRLHPAICRVLPPNDSRALASHNWRCFLFGTQAFQN